MLLGREGMLPGGRLVRGASRATDGKHRRARLLGSRVPPHRGVADEDGGPGRGVERLVVERERRASREDEIDLFVLVRILRVLLDDVVARARRDVRVDPEGADAERPPQRPPEERPSDDRDRLDLAERDALPPVRHAPDFSPADSPVARRG